MWSRPFALPVISNMRMQRVRTPIFIRLGARRKAEEKPSFLRGVMIDNVHATGAILTSSITGIPGADVQDVSLSNIRIEMEEGGKQEWVERKIPEQIPAYPEARMFGRLPSYGFYCRHVNDLRMSNVEIASTKPDERPAMHFEDVKTLRLDKLTAVAPAADQPLIRLVDVQDCLVTGCVAPAQSHTAMEVRGERSQAIRLVANDFSASKKAVSLTGGAPAGVVQSTANLDPTT